MTRLHDVATFNINGGHSADKQRLLREFIRANKLDFFFTRNNNNTYGWNWRIDVMLQHRPRPMQHRHIVADIQRLPSGRESEGWCYHVRLIFIYVPSESTRKKEREYFYNKDFFCLLSRFPAPCIIGGDFSCAVSALDCTCDIHPCWWLKTIITNFHL